MKTSKTRKWSAPVDPSQIVVKTGGLPVKGLKYKESPYRAVYVAACGLKPDQWFVWPGAPMGFHTKVKSWYRAGMPASVKAFRAADGNVVIVRDAGNAGGTARAGRSESDPSSAPDMGTQAPLPMPSDGVMRRCLAVVNKTNGLAMTITDIRAASGFSSSADAVDSLARGGYLKQIKKDNGRIAFVVSPLGKEAAAKCDKEAP